MQPPIRQGLVLGLLTTLLASAACEDAAPPSGPSAPEGAAASAAGATTATGLTFTAITTGGNHTCGIDPNGAAWCWGENLSGQLGDGTNTDRLKPTRVAGSQRFVQISAGVDHTCGITTSDLAYCWGRGALLGGGTGSGLTPTAVAGGRRFRNVSAGNNHTCAVTPSDVGFCWGVNNSLGQLGTGGGFSLTPARVARGLLWRRIIAGGQYTCGVTTDNQAYCWGFQIGPKPVAVPGGLHFRGVVAGGGGFTDAQGTESDLPHACGITTDDRAYCWGYGGEGELGNGTRTSSKTPLAVAGNRRWRQVDAGNYHSCGVTLTNVAFCWGLNQSGANGDGTTNSSTKPVRIVGSIALANISTAIGGGHTCGLTGDKRVYCWGHNSNGQLGDGTRTRRLAPVSVVGTR